MEDGGFPPRVGEQTGELTIKLIRNKFTPAFVDVPAAPTIREHLGFGKSVVQVKAEEEDEQVQSGADSQVSCDVSWATFKLSKEDQQYSRSVG